MVVLQQSVLLLRGEVEACEQNRVVVVRPVLAVCPVDDHVREALRLSHCEDLSTDVSSHAVEIVVVDVDDGLVKTSGLELSDDHLAMRPNSLSGPVLTLTRIFDPDLGKFDIVLGKDVDLAVCPLLQGLQREPGREDPVGHGNATSLQQLGRGLVLGRVARGLIHVVACVEVVWLPRDKLSGNALARPVVSSHHLCRGVEERQADLRRELGESVHVLRALQRVPWHVVGQAQGHDHGRIEATDQAGLVLRSANLVSDAAGLLCPDFSIAARQC
mmetsp:Transcript_3316/g.7842  ORF Transcript_3316/g.7842 Transcript_3316/m.7842 type:complete len:273 (-) Transcript_3316:2035-2853(-)